VISQFHTLKSCNQDAAFFFHNYQTIYSIFQFIGFSIPKVVCRTPLGLESGQIKNACITASTVRSTRDGPENARLHFKGKKAK